MTVEVQPKVQGDRGAPARATGEASRDALDAALRELLDPDRFKDYGPNGLQVEGRAGVRRLASGVTASRACIDAAIDWGADALFVHHGLFWRGHDGRLTGWLRERVARLLRHEVSLFAYHLPLDAHPQWGNNAQFGQRLGLVADARFGEQALGFMASVDEDDATAPADLDGWRARIEQVTQRPAVMAAGDGRAMRRVAWCTGGAQGYFEPAIAAGADLFITGEISEPQAHLARETGVAFIACGHHASERHGAPAVAALMAERFGLEHRFFEIANPA